MSGGSFGVGSPRLAVALKLVLPTAAQGHLAWATPAPHHPTCRSLRKEHLHMNCCSRTSF